jgi:hypothetical protein
MRPPMLDRGTGRTRPTSIDRTRCDSGWLFRPPIRRTTQQTCLPRRSPTRIRARPSLRDSHDASDHSPGMVLPSRPRNAGRYRRDLALIPEVIAFSFAAGVDPQVGLFASFCGCRVERRLPRVQSVAVACRHAVAGRGRKTPRLHGLGSGLLCLGRPFIEAFEARHADGLAGVLIDVSAAHFWDVTAAAALDKVVSRFKAQNIPVEVAGVNQSSTTLIERLDRSVVLG